MSFVDRTLRVFGLQRIGAFGGGTFKGGSVNRLNMDWAMSPLSSDLKLRGSLKTMRWRCRELKENNDHAGRFINLARENVIGPNGVGLQMAFDEQMVGSLATKLNGSVETAWARFCEHVSTDGQMSMVDAAQLWLDNVLTDGEEFTHRVRGYPYNDFKFALQSVDPDQIDTAYNRLRLQRPDGTWENEIRLGVEVDEWRRPINYWAFEGHPSETGNVRRIPLSADRITHSFIFKLRNQTRGVPWMHTAMTRMNMLGGYEEAELVASRLAACKMAFFVSKTGEEYTGQRNQKTGAIDVVAEPANMEQLPEGVEPKVIDWQHPGANFPEFTRAMLRGLASGLNVSYSALSGDLRDVNFSSIRQGILDEREGWRVLQTFAVQHFYIPVFSDWLVMALTTGQVQLPSAVTPRMVMDAIVWQPRGWDWVDPRTDVAADITARRAGARTLAAICAKQGLDWRDVIDQIAKENEYARQRGVALDFTTAGAGGVEGDSAGEDQRNGGGTNKPNGKGALNYVRLPQ